MKHSSILGLAVTGLLLSASAFGANPVYVYKSATLTSAIPTACFAADVKAAIAADTSLTPEVGAAAATFADYALGFAVAKVDGAALLRIARHSANGSVYEVDWAAYLKQFGMSLAATSTNAFGLAYADAIAASGNPLAPQIKLAGSGSNVMMASSIAAAGAGAFSDGIVAAAASSSGGAGNLAFVGNLAYTKASNITESLHLLGFYGETFSFAKSKSEAGVSLEETAGVITTAMSNACKGFYLFGAYVPTTCDSTGLLIDNETNKAAAEAVAKALATSMSRTRVLGAFAGVYKAQKGKASITDIVEVYPAAAINVQCGSNVDLTVGATATAQ